MLINYYDLLFDYLGLSWIEVMAGFAVFLLLLILMKGK